MATRPRTNVRDVVPPAPAIASPSREEQIRTRAYQLYEQRGKLEGHDMEDWLQAEAERLSGSVTRA